MHAGSLLAAVASYLDARAHDGRWLLRIEDLDPDREPPGADQEILQQLRGFALNWDGDVVRQSARTAAYAQALDRLRTQGASFPCDCSRQRIRDVGGRYDGHCRNRVRPSAGSSAWRVRVDAEPVPFQDRIQGPQAFSLDALGGDFVVRRKEGYFAYQLAVVVDDAWQGVTHVVRGSDLLDSTPRQIHLQRLLGLPTPVYAHIPVLVNPQGQKLSKQTHAETADPNQAAPLLQQTLTNLGLPTDTAPADLDPAGWLAWAIPHWHVQRVPKLASIPAHDR